MLTSPSKPTDNNTANEAPIDADQPARPGKKKEAVQLTWEVPGEDVDGFVIRYGENRSALSKEIKLSTSQLQEESDPEYGPVYRYVLKDLPSNGRLFFSIAAFKGDRISNFSEVLEEK